MAAPDVSDVPGDVFVTEAAAGGDAGGTSGDPTLDDMAAIMEAEAVVEDAAGFELETAKPADDAAKRPDETPDAAKAKADADAEAAKKVAADAKAAEEAAKAALPAKDPAETAERIKLRNEAAKLARDRQELVAKTNEAKRAVEGAKAFKEKADAFDAIPGKFKADPIGFLCDIAGVKRSNIDDVNTFLNEFLNEVIKTEKSPQEIEILRLRQEVESDRAAAKKAKEDAETAAADAKEKQIIREWEVANTTFASKSPEKYPLINDLEMGDAVHSACAEYFRLHGQVIPAAAAADLIEKNLLARAKKSTYLQKLFGPSTPAPAAKPAASAQPSNGSTQAPKRTGVTTLTGVASGDGPTLSAEHPGDDDDARMDSVLKSMRDGNELPAGMRI